ncbi:hypothetical protein JY97_07605 [Alkalispirochaeta odontotermitis]|nr:hypothetical protein JY97_07605 [Alkalispirochaeta odontotermitis]
MLLNSSGISRGGVVWLAAGIIIVLLVAYSLFSGHIPWGPTPPDQILAKTVILKKVKQVPISPKRTIVRKPAIVTIPSKEPAPTELQQPPAVETVAKPPDPSMTAQPAQEKPPASAPIITAEQTAKSQPAAEAPLTAKEQPTAKAQPKTKEQPGAKEPPVIASAAPETSPQPKTERPTAVKPAPVKKPVPAKPLAAMSKPAAREIHREKWLLSQDASSYTIQIIGVSTEKSMLKFIERNPLLKQNDIAYYESVLRGKPWFQALYGIYPTKEEARRAIEKLPENIRLSGPWIRRLAAVQNTIGK